MTIGASDTVSYRYPSSAVRFLTLLSLDQITSAMCSFIHLIAKHPKVQRKAQDEIDHVIGGDRLPDFSDRPNLPYIEAIYRELMRITPPIGVGMPRALTENDVYEGYFLPKGKSIFHVFRGSPK